MHERIILACPSVSALPTRKHDYCATIAPYTTPPPTPPVYAIHHSILVMAISCKGQRVSLAEGRRNRGIRRVVLDPSLHTHTYIHLSFYLSVSLYLHLYSFTRSLSTHTHIYISLSIYLYLSISIYIVLLDPSQHTHTHTYISLSIYLYLSFSIYIDILFRNPSSDKGVQAGGRDRGTDNQTRFVLYLYEVYRSS